MVPFVEMQLNGLVPDLFTYSAAISAYGKAKRPDKAMGLLEQMQRKGLNPT